MLLVAPCNAYIPGFWTTLDSFFLLGGQSRLLCQEPLWILSKDLLLVCLIKSADAGPTAQTWFTFAFQSTVLMQSRPDPRGIEGLRSSALIFCFCFHEMSFFLLLLLLSRFFGWDVISIIHSGILSFSSTLEYLYFLLTHTQNRALSYYRSFIVGFVVRGFVSVPQVEHSLAGSASTGNSHPYSQIICFNFDPSGFFRFCAQWFGQ